eukprot:PhM_4_TR10007/c0_g1_i1/m.18423/K05692/ACTB_G1; actin beta/gamma 1
MSDDAPPPPPAYDIGPALIIDNGTCRTKAGVCGGTKPTLNFPTLLGQPSKRTRLIKRRDVAEEDALPSVCIGDDALRHASRVDLSWPIEGGNITDWDGMTSIWKHIYADLEFEDTSEFPVLITEPPMNPRRTRERTMETFFETFEVPYYCPMLAGSCALYASGRTTGLVVDIGEGVTHVVPVYDSFPVPAAIERTNVAGRTVTDYLMRILCDRGYSFTTNRDREVVRDLKESLGFVMHNDRDPAVEYTSDYHLPDGQKIQIGDERYRAPEVLFDPMIVNNESAALHTLVSNAIKSCGIDIRKTLMSNIVLSGAGSLFEGLGKRLGDELGLLHSGMFSTMRVIEAPDRANNVWVGASVIATLSTFSTLCVDKEKYDEEGASCLPALTT